MKSKVYLDYNATTPVHPELVPFVLENLNKFGNASSVHWAGREAKKLISEARQNLARFLGADELELVFTSGGSEANNLALKGFAELLDQDLKLRGRREIFVSSVEHPSVLKTLDFLKRHGFVIRTIPVTPVTEASSISVDLHWLKQNISERTALISCQLVNNETGQIFPLKEMTEIAHSVGALVHSDMVQALGKISVNLNDLGVDFASFAGHKFYGLKGAGALYVRRGTRFEPLIHGGGQERSRRAGTENALAIATMGRAVEKLGPYLQSETKRLEVLRDSIEAFAAKEIGGASFNAQGPQRVLNTASIVFDRLDGETMLINLDNRGFAVSSGAACSSGSQEPSPVLRALGFSRERASSSLRVSLGWLTTEVEVEAFKIALREAVQNMRDAQASLDESGGDLELWQPGVELKKTGAEGKANGI